MRRSPPCLLKRRVPQIALPKPSKGCQGTPLELVQNFQRLGCRDVLVRRHFIRFVGKFPHDS